VSPDRPTPVFARGPRAASSATSIRPGVGGDPGSTPDPQARKLRAIAVIGNHTPRQCGIATFTTHLSAALGDEIAGLDCFVLAMNDPGRRHAYPGRVRFEIDEGDVGSYRRAADFLNVNPVDMVSLQHEYGIFGGPAGSHIIALLRELRMPVVTTLHTILAEPSSAQRAVMDEIVQLSERVVVMSRRGAELLRTVHEASADKIDLIPHGIPFLPDARSSKERVGVEGKRVMLTFGLLSPDKGIEYVIEALPAILERYPDVTYIVLGATHPHVRDRHGETYRLMLERRARRLGVDSSVIFHDRFVSQGELNEFLSAADLYVTPYLNEEQITSGTLAYAVGSGKAVISTPYWYASELLADGRGKLVPSRDSGSIARAALDLFDDDGKRDAMCRRAAAYGQEMSWPAVARAYALTFERARGAQAQRTRTVFQARSLASRPAELPPTNLDHLRHMTDGTGILQHAAFTVPRREDGYCLDDNARALLVMALTEEAGSEDRALVRSLAGRYLAFVRHAWNGERGRFRNFMSYARTWLEESGSEDSHGRAVWALGTVIGRSTDPGRRSVSSTLFHDALPIVPALTSPRAWAFTLLGIEEYLRVFEGDSGVQAQRDVLAERLLDLFQRSSETDWPWFEERLTYCGARISQALLLSGARMDRGVMLEAGLRSLEWLVSVQLSAEGYFAPIGSNGFYGKDGTKARFDQQPVEASAMVSACLDARRVTGDERWARRARHAFDWYLGQNELQQPVYDASTGGCRDGLHEDRVNENQGAESTLAFQLSLLEMRAADRIVEADVVSRSVPSPLPDTSGRPVGTTVHGVHGVRAAERGATA
jgi:glycosyltransferase involved in cell wall biosynthesis